MLRMKRRISQPAVLSLHWVDRDYACTEKNGSIKLGDRCKLYCPNCDAPECVFGGPTLKQKQAKVGRGMTDAHREAMGVSIKKRFARMRALGLNSQGKPLSECCWNCTNLRRDGNHVYVCRYAPADARRIGRRSMISRTPEKLGCNQFNLRLVGIPMLEDD